MRAGPRTGAPRPGRRALVSSRWRRWTWRALLAIALVLLAPLPVLLALRWLPPPSTSFMLQSPARPVHHEWVSWDQIPPHVALAVVAAEDQRFALHSGFDLDAIRDAMADNRARARPRGASTISQQVAKNLFLWPGGGYARKAMEAWITVLIEQCWPKRRILEMYLNIAEMGPGVYGVEAAAWRWFDRPAAALQPREAALLAAMLPSPRRMRPDEPTRAHAARAAWIQTQMRNLGSGWLEGL